MSYGAHLLSGRTADSEPSFVLRFENAQYLFNSAEGTQRVMQQRGITNKRTRAIFLTGLDSRTAGGLSGLIFTMGDAAGPGKKASIDVIGPENLRYLLATMRLFIIRKDVNVNPIEHPLSLPPPEVPLPIYQDVNITVYSVAVSTSPSSSVSSSPTISTERKRKRSLSQERATLPPAPSETPISDSTPTGPPSSILRHINSVLNAMFSPVRPPPTVFPHPKTPGALPQGAYSPRRSPSPGSTEGQSYAKLMYGPMPPVPSHRESLSYVIVGPSKRGQFDSKKAAELGVKGKDCGILTSGQSCWVPDATAEGGKREVKPEMVLGVGTPASVTLVIDCPTPAHIPSLVSNSIWKPYQAAKDGIWPVYVVWHRWGTFPESPEYQAWMASFGPDAQHLSGDASLLNNQSSFESSAVCNAHFNLLDPSMFPREPVFSRAELPLPPNVYPMRPGMIIDILPRKPPRISQGSKVGESGPGDSLLQVLSLKPDALLEGVSERLPKFIEEIEIAQEAVVDAQLRPPTSETPQPGDDIVVTPLGTGSSLPSKYRNVSATHLAVPGVDGDILLDCGEGTLGQLTRRFGHEEGGIAKVLAGLKVIFISHLHADHHTGLARLLRARRDVCDPSNRLYLVSTPRIHQQLRELQVIEDLGIESGMVQCLDIFATVDPSQRTQDKASARIDPALYDEMRSVSGLASVQAVRVRHRGRDCFGGVLTHRSGWKIVYSGDTMYCPELARFGRDATLLIHEATIEDDDPVEREALLQLRSFNKMNDLPPPESELYSEIAKKKGHSQFADAVAVGREMRARNVLLTHFSQRYPKGADLKLAAMPEGADEETVKNAETQTIAMALDLISFRIKNMWKLRTYEKAIAVYFEGKAKEEHEEEQAQAAAAAAAAATEGGKGKGKNKKEGKPAKGSSGDGPRGEGESGGRGGKKGQQKKGGSGDVATAG